MPAARTYDTLEFPDYLDGTGSTSVTLWQETPAGRPAPVAQATPPRRSGSGPRKRRASGDVVQARLDAMTRTLLGVGVAAVEYPGGKGRASWRVRLDDGRAVIVSRRESPTRSLLDARVLEVLHRHGAPVPAPLAYNGIVLVQEDVGDARVSEQLLRGTDRRTYGAVVPALVDSLWHVYEAADRAGLVAHVPIIGRDDDWVRAFIDRTALIGHRLALPCPCPDIDRLQDLFQVLTPEFVKWDARPANAMRRDDGRICWIDWEHCGARHRLDDLAWLLADDTMPSCPDEEMGLIEAVLPRYEGGVLGRLSREYLLAFGANHAANRLARILSNKGDAPWQPEDQIAPTDEERVRRSEAVGLARRAARWSAGSKAMRKLASWFGDVADHLASGD